jgi:hypothetical protein
MNYSISFAGIDFLLSPGFCRAPINSYFRVFSSDQAKGDLSCSIASVEEDPGLDALPPSSRHWETARIGDRIELVRRYRGGAVLWRARIALDGSTARLSVNPARWRESYFDVDDLLWRDLALFMVMFRLRNEQGLLVHGAASILDGSGVLCVGPSGAGKTTIATLLRCDGPAEVLSDEHPIVRRSADPESSGSEFRVYGSPWPSCGGYVSAESAPLKRIYFLEHGPENTVAPVGRREAVARLLQVATIPWDCADLFDPCLETVETLLARVPAAVLSFRPDAEVVDVIRQDLAAGREIV